MYLRWMVRPGENGVDFGIWKNIKPAQLLIPLDLHVMRTAISLNLIRKAAADWKTVLELTAVLRKINPNDPVVYDFALFGMSMNEGKFKN